MKVFNVYLYENDELIDQTQIDNWDSELAWNLFKGEFGHTNLNNTARIEFEEVEEDD